MIFVGELINSSRPSVAKAIEAHDRYFIQQTAREQFENGATFIDVNAGIFVDDEIKHLKWLVESVQQAVEAPCCIDSPNPKAIEAALSVHRGAAMLNSISLEKARYETMLPVISGGNLKVIALCMSDLGMPETADQRVAIAEKLINGLVKNNITIENIYIDPLVQPISTNDTFGIEFLEAIQRIMTNFQGVHTICGLSNISYGLPERNFLNQTFAVMAIGRGLDACILNPLDKRIMASIIAAEVLMGKDAYCANFINAFRSGKFAL